MTLVLKKIKQSFDWDTYLSENYELKETNSPNEVRICCPNCMDRKFKCYVNTDKGVFNCFKCDFHTSRKYDVVHFVAKTESITYVAALMRITADYAPRAPSDEFMDTWLRKIAEPAQDDPVAEVVHTNFPPDARDIVFETGDPVWEYAQSRGLTEELLNLVKAKGVYGASPRLLFPVYAGNGILASWQARDVTGKSAAKYTSAPNSKLAELVWPNVGNKGEVVLVEGILDALAIRNATSWSSYATFGKHISERQCALLYELGARSVTLWYDKRDAHKDMMKAVKMLNDHMDKVSVVSFDSWESSMDVGDTLRIPNVYAQLAIEQQIRSSIDCSSLDYQKWCLCL